MKSFVTIHKAALKRHGQAALEQRLPKPKSVRTLSAMTDDRYLSAMAKCIFQAGFVWKVVENMWPGFEQVFVGFSLEDLSALQPRQIDAVKQDQRIIRNSQKIKALIAAGVVGKSPTGKAALAACHQAFDRWREESGRPYSELSMIAACSV